MHWRVNRGGATTTELTALARRIRDQVRESFGVTLQLEPTLVGGELQQPTGSCPRPAHDRM
jgi:UDP-N-acetylenolpyruvoylglucosamine reductase